MNAPLYLHLPSGSALPRFPIPRPFKAVVIVEQDVQPDWRALVSRWIVGGGCLYMMAGGGGAPSGTTVWIAPLLS